MSISTTTNDGDKSNSDDKNGNAAGGDSSAEHPDVKLASAIANFIASIPKPSSYDDDDDKEDGGPTSDTTQEERITLDLTAGDLFRLSKYLC